MRVSILSLVLLGACSVPDIDLEGRPCPCIEGYRCDTATMICVRDVDGGGTGMDAGPIVDAGPVPDGGMVEPDGGGVVVDGGPGDSGIMMPDGGGCYYDDFGDGSLEGWNVTAGSWVEMAGEMSQTDDGAALALAYALPTAGTRNFRARLRMRQISGGFGHAMEIIFRVQGDPSLAMYFCNWEPNSHRMILMRQSAAGATFSLEELDVAVPPSFDELAPVTMVLEVTGTTFQCRLEEISGTAIATTDGMFSTGYLGIKTYLMSGAFDWFEVCPMP